MIKVSKDDDGAGGSLRGYVNAPYARLVELFGQPNSEGDGYKVSTEWSLEFDGHPFRLYDYKDTDLYDSDGPTVEEFRAKKSYEWHVGGDNTLPWERMVRELKEMLARD